MAPEIKYLFEPRTVAVIGASHRQDKVGYKILANILASNYPGKIFPVNPQGGEILGCRVCKSIDEIEGEIDLATIVIPAKSVMEAVEGCARKKTRFLAIISSGFSEVGNLEEESGIVGFAREHNMRVLGPNIFGIYSSIAPLNATFGPADIRAGNVAIITQSGALGIGMIGRTAVERIGLSAMVSVGNKSDLDEADLMEYLVAHQGTRIIMMYIEGLKQGERFISMLKRATEKKPVIVLKAGRSRRGAIAAASHTGSLAGSDAVFDALMKQCGVLRAENLEEAFSWVKFLAKAPVPKGENTVIITNGGGIGVMATDACEKYGVNLYDNLQVLNDTFRSVTPDFGSTKNPVDLTGQADSESYNAALDAALKSEKVESVIALYCETAVFDSRNLPAMLESNFQKYQAGEKPLLFSIFGGAGIEHAMQELRAKCIPVFTDVYQAVSCLGALLNYYRYLAANTGETDDAEVDAVASGARVEAAKKEGRSALFINEAQQVMRLAGVPVPKSTVAGNIDQAVRRAEEIGYPVVMKIVSKDIIHKSDVGGVALDLLNREEVLDAYQAIIHNCRTRRPEAVIEGVEISEMVRAGTETIVGARRDKVFGPIIMFGSGGKYVEVMKDVSFRALPLSRKQVMGMIEGIRSYPLLLGVRGEGKKDIAAVVDTVIRLGAVIRKCPGISDIEVNPLVVYEEGRGVKAVDIRILLSNP